MISIRADRLAGPIIAVLGLSLAFVVAIYPSWAPVAYYTCLPFIGRDLLEYGIKVVLQILLAAAFLVLTSERMLSLRSYSVFRKVTALLGAITVLPFGAVAIYLSILYYQQIVLRGAGVSCNVDWWGGFFVGSVWISPVVAYVLDVIVSRRVRFRNHVLLLPLFSCLSFLVHIVVFALFLAR